VKREANRNPQRVARFPWFTVDREGFRSLLPAASDKADSKTDAVADSAPSDVAALPAKPAQQSAQSAQSAQPKSDELAPFEAATPIALNWRVENPGGQQLLTGSFHPLDDDKWEQREGWHIHSTLADSFSELFIMLRRFVVPPSRACRGLAVVVTCCVMQCRRYLSVAVARLSEALAGLPSAAKDLPLPLVRLAIDYLTVPEAFLLVRLDGECLLDLQRRVGQEFNDAPVRSLCRCVRFLR